MSTKTSQRGFTLIELLVVIAIIGILASVVLASLNSARNKGADAAIKANLANVRAQAELYYDGVGASTYGTAKVANTTCTAGMFGDTTVAAAIASIETAAGGDVTCAIGVNGATWALSAPLKGGGNWCVSSAGDSKSGTATQALVGDPATC